MTSSVTAGSGELNASTAVSIVNSAIAGERRGIDLVAGAGGDGVLYFAGLYILSERKAAMLRTACACFASLYVRVLARAANGRLCVFFAGLYVLSERKAALLRTACACFASLRSGPRAGR